MATPLNLHPYQKRGVDLILDRFFLEGKSGFGLLLDPGLGKTAITLSAIRDLRGLGEVRKTLIVAPLRVVYSVWPREVSKWGFRCRVSIVHGTPKQRTAALQADADLYLINPESIPWLEKTFNLEGFELIVLDESTKFKSWTAKRTKSLRRLLKTNPAIRRLILTGTPVPNTLADLFPQVYALDDGETLGKSLTFFRTRYMRQGGFKGHEWIFREEMRGVFEEQIAPLVLRLAAKDHLQLPPILYNPVWVDLQPEPFAKYRQMERELFVLLDSGEDLLASSAGAAYAACRQLANGGIYEYLPTDERITHHVHDQKVDALEDVVEELSGKPILVAYQFWHDLERILRRFPGSPAINGKTPAKEADAIVDRWNAKQIPILLVQPQSLSHGVNLQGGGNDVAWFGLTDQLEIYLQLNCRLHRQGVEGTVRIHHLLTANTVDEAIHDRLKSKDRSQQALLESLAKYRESRRDSQDAGDLPRRGSRGDSRDPGTTPGKRSHRERILPRL